MASRCRRRATSSIAAGVDPHDLAFRPDRRLLQERQITRSGRNVQHSFAGPEGAKLHGLPLPQAMKPERPHIGHHVVALRQRRKQFLDVAGLGLQLRTSPQES